jgi:uncharacterized RDD family membrane protein YckC
MSVIKVPTSFNIDVEFEIPEFYRRALALILDVLVIFFYCKIAVEVIHIFWTGNPLDINNDYNLWGLSRLLIFLPVVIYHIVCEVTMNGQSVGKKIMGLRVVNENGGRPSFSQFLIRWFLREIWFLLILAMGINSAATDSTTEGIILILFVVGYFITDIVLVVSSNKSQRIGDMLAKTIIIRTKQRASIEETVFREVADSYVPQFPQIMQLSDKDINAVKSILETSRKKGDFHMASAASEKIKAHLKIVTPLPPFDFLEVLLKDYNYLSTK